VGRSDPADVMRSPACHRSGPATERTCDAGSGSAGTRGGRGCTLICTPACATGGRSCDWWTANQPRIPGKGTLAVGPVPRLTPLSSIISLVRRSAIAAHHGGRENMPPFLQICPETHPSNPSRKVGAHTRYTPPRETKNPLCLQGVSCSASRTRTCNPAVTVDPEAFAPVRTISSP